MRIKIKDNEKDFEFQASAVTDVLYNRIFNQDPEQYFIKRAEILSDPRMKKDMENVEQIKQLPEGDKRRVELAAEIAENKSIFSLSASLETFARQFGYITYIEANTAPENVYKELSLDGYYIWLMNFDSGFFREHAQEFIGLYETNKRSSSTLKNHQGR